MSGLLEINVSLFSQVIVLQSEIMKGFSQVLLAPAIKRAQRGRGDIAYQEIYNVLQCEEWRNVGDNRNNKSDNKSCNIYNLLPT